MTLNDISVVYRPFVGFHLRQLFAEELILVALPYGDSIKLAIWTPNTPLKPLGGEFLFKDQPFQHVSFTTFDP